jgi:vacuolar-type H+-ATPase subunit C/Vma6
MGAEISLNRYLYKECQATFMKFPLQMALLFAFFIAKEMQIRDIVTILSGRNLGLAPERIRTYLITL